MEIVNISNSSKPNTHPSLDVVDAKIKILLEISDEFIFPAYYTHTNKQMWKISNQYTHYSNETFVLCGVDEGINKALDLAIEHISIAKNKYFDKNNT